MSRAMTLAQIALKARGYEPLLQSGTAITSRLYAPVSLATGANGVDEMGNGNKDRHAHVRRSPC
jgi:hypothetical protein